MNILFLGDLHVGDSRGERHGEIKTAVESVVKKAAIRGIDATVLCGDLFDTFRYPGEDNIEFAAKLVDIFLEYGPTHILKGNHDWRDIRLWETLARDSGVHVHIVPEIATVTKGRETVNLFILPYLQKHALKNGFEPVTQAFFNRPDKSVKGILAAHVALENTVPGLGEPAIPVPYLKSLAAEGVCSAFFGHIHQHGLLNEKLRGLPFPCRYTGTLWRTTFSEENVDLGAYLYDTTTGETHDIRVDGRKLKTLRYESVDDVKAHLEKDVSALNVNTRHDGKLSELPPVIRVAVNQPCMRQTLLNTMNEIIGNEAAQNIKVKVTPPTVSGVKGKETSSSLGDLSVTTMWKEYVREKTGGKTDSFLETAGLVALSGGTGKEVLEVFAGEISKDTEVGAFTPDISGMEKKGSGESPTGNAKKGVSQKARGKTAKTKEATPAYEQMTFQEEKRPLSVEDVLSFDDVKNTDGKMTGSETKPGKGKNVDTTKNVSDVEDSDDAFMLFDM